MPIASVFVDLQSRGTEKKRRWAEHTLRASALQNQQREMCRDPGASLASPARPCRHSTTWPRAASPRPPPRRLGPPPVSLTTPLTQPSPAPPAAVMVGLPARGKTYIATKLAYYLNWVMLPCKGTTRSHNRMRRAARWRCIAQRTRQRSPWRRCLPPAVFNLGSYRRNLLGAQTPSRFFHPENKEGAALRR